MSLTDAKIRSLKPTDKPFKVSDSHGLYLLVKPGGSRLWYLKYRINGKESRIALGAYPAVSLSDARQQREGIRKMLALNINPAKQRAAERIAGTPEKVFKTVALSWHKSNLKWSQNTADRLLASMNNHIFPIIGHLSVSELKPRNFSLPTEIRGFFCPKIGCGATQDTTDNFEILLLRRRFGALVGQFHPVRQHSVGLFQAHAFWRREQLDSDRITPTFTDFGLHFEQGVLGRAVGQLVGLGQQDVHRHAAGDGPIEHQQVEVGHRMADVHHQNQTLQTLAAAQISFQVTLPVQLQRDRYFCVSVARQVDQTPIIV